MKTIIYPIIRVKCGTPKCKEEGTFEGYDHAGLSGWNWREGHGWTCGRCNLARVGHAVQKQAALL